MSDERQGSQDVKADEESKKKSDGSDASSDSNKSSNSDSKDDSKASDSSDKKSSGESDKKDGSGKTTEPHDDKSSKDSKDAQQGKGSSDVGSSLKEMAGVVEENESKGGADTKGQQDVAGGGGGLPNKKKKQSPLKKLMALAQAAIHVIQSLLMTAILAVLSALIAAVVAAVTAVVSAIVAAVMAIVSAVAAALGVSVGVAAILTVGIALLAVAIVVAVVVVVNNNNTAVKDDMVPCEEIDMSYMEVPDGISPKAWTTAKLIYTFFRTYGDAAANEAGNDEYLYTDEMIAAILGNWQVESSVDTTAVETVFDEPYAIGPMKLWLWNGGVNVYYNWHEDMDGDKVYDNTTMDPYYVIDDGDTVLHTVGPLADDSGDDNVSFEDSSDSRGFGVSFSNDYVFHQPIAFEVKWFKDLYNTSYWNEFSTIQYMGIGLGQWTNTRNTGLMDYAEENNREWYDLTVQLMYSLSDDGKASWLKSWNGTYTDDSFTVEIPEENSDGEVINVRTVTWTNGMEYDGVVMETAAAIAYNTERFASGWEVAPIDSIENRVNNAFMWYNIITEWKEGVDYTLGAGSSLWGALDSLSVTVGDVSQQSGARSCTDLYFFSNSSLAEAIVSYAWGPGQSDRNDGTLCWRHLFSTMTNGNDPYYRSCDRTVAIAVWWSGTDSDYPIGNTETQLDYLIGKDIAYRSMLQGDLSGGMSSDTAWWMEVDMSNATTPEEFIALLRPGDILIRNDAARVKDGFVVWDRDGDGVIEDGVTVESKDDIIGHTLMYVGNDVIRRRFPDASSEYLFVSGSLKQRSPSVGTMYWSDFDPMGSGYESYFVYRNMGTYVSEAGRANVALTCAGHSNDE